jgi:FlaA1/EpsC-like NDP-sugar epimerase
VSDLGFLIEVFSKVHPDIVIHSAALKHIDLAEKNPTQAIKMNVLGSHNVVNAAFICDVPLTVGISTDKACEPKSVYGYTKKLMEEMFMSAHTEKNRFVCTRFANVAGSNGSVIPYWKGLVERGEGLKLTDKDMNRLMFTKSDAAELIQKAIELSDLDKSESFVLSKKMKSVNLYALAKFMSDKEVEVVGKRPGEKLNESLISESELPFTTNLQDDYVKITKKQTDHWLRLFREYSSLSATVATTADLERLVNQ